MKKVIVKKLLTLALAICLTFTAAYSFAPAAAIKALAVGDVTNPTVIQPNSNTDLSGNWNDIKRTYQHCYKVTLPADGIFSVTVVGKNTEYMTFAITENQSYEKDLAAVHLGNRNPASPDSGTISRVFSAGTYFIFVEHELGLSDIAQYKIKTTFESFGFTENPDSYDLPKAFNPGTTYTDAITIVDSEDWYKLRITEDAKYALKATTYHNTVYFSLKDADLNQIVEKNYCRSSGVEYLFLKPGIYYFKMHGAESKYSFSLSKAQIPQTKLTKVKAVKNRKVDVTFKEIKDTKGYQIRYSTDKNFKKNVKTKTFESYKARSVNGNKRTYTVPKLKKNKKYYFQIRTYILNYNDKYFSEWSKTKSVKVK